MTTPPLRRCPTCAQKLPDEGIGFRDWAVWLKDTFPGKVGPSDVDWMLERHGKFLIIEFKSKGVRVPIGQMITLGRLHRDLDADIWFVQEPKKYGDTLTLVPMNKAHRFPPVDAVELTVAAFRKRLAQWWAAADSKEEL